MSLVYASNVLPATREANAIQIDRMCRALSSAGWRVVLTAIGKRPPGALPYQVAILPWRSRRLRNPLMRVLIRHLLRRDQARVLLTRSPLLALAGLNAAAPIILELHSLPAAQTQMQAALSQLLTHPNLRRIVTISQALVDDLVAEYGPPHPGCDIVVAHDGAEAGPRPGQMSSHDRPITVGYFGHLYPGKGMEMIAVLASLLPEMRFEVYGGTEADISRWRAACANQANLTLHGHIPHVEVAPRMASCDILIAPYATQVSHAGGGDIGRWMSPLKLFEYMAAERPIVASDLPVLREVVCDGETALLCEPGDPAAFADALMRLGADPALRARLARAGRDLLEAEYTWDRRARRILEGIVNNE
ncbi:MAG: glycosyltransferase [Rubellimicrobium sp.]|nr:glycosyltransferase [Rubellimicrobium sp.]